MNSILALDAAALDSARRLSQAQPQAKFLGNIANTLAPIAGAVAPFIPGAGPIAAGIGAASALFGGGGGGGGGGNPYAGALGTQALAQGDQQVAMNLMNQGYGMQNKAANDTMSAYIQLLQKFQDPAFSMLRNTQYIPIGSLQGVSAPQINSLWSGNASQVPQLGSTGGINPYLSAILQAGTMPQINFGGFNGTQLQAPNPQQPAPAGGGATTQPIAQRPEGGGSQGGARTLPIGLRFGGTLSRFMGDDGAGAFGGPMMAGAY